MVHRSKSVQRETNGTQSLGGDTVTMPRSQLINMCVLQIFIEKGNAKIYNNINNITVIHYRCLLSTETFTTALTKTNYIERWLKLIIYQTNNK